MNKTELEVKLKELEATMSQQDDTRRELQSDITRLENQLQDIGKPELTSAQFDAIHEAVETGLDDAFGTYDINDMFDKEFSIGYDDNIEVDLSINDCGKVRDSIIEEIEKLFNVKQDDND